MHNKSSDTIQIFLDKVFILDKSEDLLFHDDTTNVLLEQGLNDILSLYIDRYKPQ